jgi:hypothetical protein
MELVDSDSRRWLCKKDNATFLVNQGWTTEGQTPQLATLGGSQRLSLKSYAIGIVANFLLPGAGVIYAGKKVGIAYTILTVVFFVVLWPASIVVAVISYVHTVIAISDRNSQIRSSQPSRNKANRSSGTCRSADRREHKVQKLWWLHESQLDLLSPLWHQN